MSNKYALNYPNLIVKVVDKRILIVKINRPKYRNAVNPQTAEELYQVFNEFDQNDDLKIAILTGEGSYFCAGFDLQHLAQQGKKDQSVEKDTQTISKWSKFNNSAPMGVSRLKLSKPVIASVEGFAVAGGLELSLWCDMIVTHKEAVFGVFCRRFGVPLIDGGTIRLVVGLNRARDMILTGRTVKGDEAYQIGLANRLVEKDQVLQTSIDLAKQIISNPEYAMLSDRQSLMDSTFPQYERDFMNEFRLGLTPILRGESTKGASRFSFEKEGRGGTFKHQTPKL